MRTGPALDHITDKGQLICSFHEAASTLGHCQQGMDGTTPKSLASHLAFNYLHLLEVQS